MLDFVWPMPSLPADAAWMLTACLPEDGRVDRTFGFDEPDLIGKANDAWWQLAVQYDLLDGDRKFLVSVGPTDDDVPARPHWARVRLEQEWNVVGGGADQGVLGGPPGRPGFVMMSLDEGVVVGGTTWDDAIGVIALPRPAAASAIRKFVARM